MGWLSVTINKRKASCLATLAALVFAAATGCGTKASNLVKVAGTVSLDGAPLEGAKVTFYPSSGDAPPMGVSDGSGRFELSTFDIKTRESMDGALPGEYKVTVEIPAPPSGRTPGSPEAMEAAHMASKKTAAPKVAKVLHANYGDVSKTPLKQVVPPQGPVALKLTKSGT
jgi:hypothetical protein